MFCQTLHLEFTRRVATCYIQPKTDLTTDFVFSKHPPSHGQSECYLRGEKQKHGGEKRLWFTHFWLRPVLYNRSTRGHCSPLFFCFYFLSPSFMFSWPLGRTWGRTWNSLGLFENKIPSRINWGLLKHFLYDVKKNVHVSIFNDDTTQGHITSLSLYKKSSISAKAWMDSTIKSHMTASLGLCTV